jgi:hypothetical protein
VDDGVEILMPPGWQVDQPDAGIGKFGMALTAINSDQMSPLSQPLGKLFSEGLKAAIPGRNSPRADDGNARRLPAPGF